jgi:hypothetical protein
MWLDGNLFRPPCSVRSTKTRPTMGKYYPHPDMRCAHRSCPYRATLFAISDPRHEHSPSPQSKVERTLGVILAVTIIVVLGLSTQEDATTLLEQALSSERPSDDATVPFNGVAMATVTNVIESYVPTTSTDLVAVALGESVGGVVGATFSVAINWLLQTTRNQAMANTVAAGSSDDDSTVNDSNRRRTNFLSQALSDSDFFVANGASLSLLEAVGINARVAQLSSVLIASIPSQLVKLGPIIKERRSREDQLLQQLLSEEEELMRKAAKSNFFTWSYVMPTLSAATSSQKKLTMTNPAELVPVLGDATAIDFVEVFSDVTRWLEYEYVDH